jgi:aminoglycoside phosphotransferase (APT) family kinase protein
MEWIPDRPLTSEKAAALIGSSFPNIDAAAPRRLGSGWLFDAFLTNDGWAFRFPRSKRSANVFDEEARVLDLVSQILPSQIRVPHVELRAKPTPRFPLPFVGHRFVTGSAADTVDEGLMPTIAREIAMFLSVLHSTPAPVAGAAGIHQIDIESNGRREWLEHGIAVAAQLRGKDAVVDRALDWLATASLTPPAGGTLQLIHGSLEAQNVLIDPVTGFLVGVVDWTEGQLGDAARDFVFLVHWRGWRFAEEVLRLYQRAVDREFRTRLRYMAQLLSLMGLAFAHEQGSDTARHIREVHNAFAPSDISGQVPAAP